MVLLDKITGKLMIDFALSSLSTPNIRELGNDDGHGSENVTTKKKSRFSNFIAIIPTR